MTHEEYQDKVIDLISSNKFERNITKDEVLILNKETYSIIEQIRDLRDEQKNLVRSS